LATGCCQIRSRCYAPYLEKALAFDSDEINAIVKDLALLKHLFKAKMETKAPDDLNER